MSGEWHDWVGRTTTLTTLLDPGQANKMAVTLDREPTYSTGDELPGGWHWLYFHDAIRSSELGPDGHPRLGIVMPPVPLPRRMWAAGRLEFLAPIPLGVEAQRTTTFTDIVPKQGRSGPLVFVSIEHLIQAEGRDCLRETQTIVYREADAITTATPQAEAEAGIASRTWTLDSTALFRYSALTFNGHRIHYDADYARDREGYPGLVVHGPLIATLLLDLATEAGQVRSFDYRAKSPIISPSPFTVHRGETADGAAQLWATDGGRVAMEASAQYY